VLRLSLRNAWDHRLRFLMTTFAVVIGVGFVVGSFVVTDSIRASVDQLFADITSGTDVSVRAETNLDLTASAARGRVPASLVDSVREVDGVEAAEGSVGGYAQLVDLDNQGVAARHCVLGDWQPLEAFPLRAELAQCSEGFIRFDELHPTGASNRCGDLDSGDQSGHNHIGYLDPGIDILRSLFLDIAFHQRAGIQVEDHSRISTRISETCRSPWFIAAGMTGFNF